MSGTAPDPLSRLVHDAAARIRRYAPIDALRATCGGGLIVDIRSSEARARLGVIPGSLHIPRTVLEWRVAVESPWRNPHLGDPDERLILLCDHGCSSILAAGNLIDLGLTGAGDVVGGFEAWSEQGLPVVPHATPAPAPNRLEGMDPPAPVDPGALIQRCPSPAPAASQKPP